MNLDITAKEYRDLLDLLSIAHGVLTAHRGEEDDVRVADYEKVIQRFYALAEQMGSGNLVAFNPEISKYFPTEEYEDAGRGWDFIGEFAENSFWEELIDRLAERDLMRQRGGLDAFDALGHDERLALLEPIVERYAREFEKNGIENVSVKLEGAP